MCPLKSMEWAAGRLDPRWIGAHMPAVGEPRCMPPEQRADIAGFPGRIRMLGLTCEPWRHRNSELEHMAGILRSPCIGSTEMRGTQPPLPIRRMQWMSSAACDGRA